MAPFLPRVPQTPGLPGTSSNLWGKAAPQGGSLRTPSSAWPPQGHVEQGNPHPRVLGSSQRERAPGDASLQRSPDSPLECPRGSPERQKDGKGHIATSGGAREQGQNPGLLTLRPAVFPTVPDERVGHPLSKVCSGHCEDGGREGSSGLGFVRGTCCPPAASPLLAPSTVETGS